MNKLQAVELKNRGSIPGGRKRFFLREATRPVLGPIQPPILLVPGAGTGGGVKRPRHEANHQRSFSGEVRNKLSCTHTAPHVHGDELLQKPIC